MAEAKATPEAQDAAFPFSVITNLRVNGNDVVVPIVQEEASVVAAASNAAKTSRSTGGFVGSATPLPFTGVIVFTGFRQDEGNNSGLVEEAVKGLDDSRVCECEARTCSGGVSVQVRVQADTTNAASTVLHATAGRVASRLGCDVRVCRVVGGAVWRVVVRGRWARDELVKKGSSLTGAATVARIVDGAEFARNDVFRAATHNKGIMNGIEGVARALGLSCASVEAAAHNTNCDGDDGPYTSLTSFACTHERLEEGDLEGSITVCLPDLSPSLPLSETQAIARRMVGAKDDAALAVVLGAVGLAQNMAALWALGTEGIQRGHMQLHAANVAVMGGAKGKDEVDRVVAAMQAANDISVSRAKLVVASLHS